MSRDDDARGQTFDVPLPGPRKGLIEVIDVENYVSLGCGKAPEIHQVGVTAGLHPEPGLCG